MNVSITDYQTNILSAAEHSLAEAFGRTRSELTNRARAIVGNRTDAEDAVQEAAVRAWQARKRFRAGADPGPWLRRIVTRTAIDLARERNRRERLGSTPVAFDASPEERTVRAETLTAIGGAAARLAPESRRILLLHDVAGFTSHEIAQLDNMPYHTVRTRLRRARLSLRHQLNELREAI